MAVPMRFTTFKSVKDNVPVTYEGWDAFRKLFKLRVTPNKSSVPLYCAAEYIAPRRVMENVLHISFGIIDVDDYDEAAVSHACDELDSLGVGYIFHTTHSHHSGLSQGKFKCRIIIPFSRSVQPEEWDRVWAGLNDICGGIADTACRNPNAIYYFPSCPPGDPENTAVIAEVPGNALDIKQVLELTPAVKAEDSFIPQVDPAVLKRIESSVRYQLASMFLEKFPPAVSGHHGDVTTLRAAMVGGDFGLNDEQFWPLLENYNAKCKPPWKAKELKQKLANANKYRGLPVGWRLVNRNDCDVVEAKHVKTFAEKHAKKDGNHPLGILGRRLQRVLRGEPIGPEAVQVFESVAQFLARHYPNADPVALALLMEKSIEATHKAGNREVTVEMVGQRISDAQQERQAHQAEEQLDRQALERLANKDAFAAIGLDRATVYSKDEIKKFAESVGLTPKEFTKRWIIQFDKSFYFFIGGQYTRRPYKDAEAGNMVKTALAPAHLRMYKDGQQGPAPMTMGDLMSNYGSVAHEVVVDMGAQESRYDGSNQVFTEAPCPFRKMVPTQSALVEEWIHLMCGDMEDKVNDWLACIPLLSKPIACLYLYGEPRSGKSLLANGASRIWLNPDQGGPVKLESIAGNFNDNIRKSPLVFGDEDVPRDFHGEPRTAYMRELVQASSHDYKRKHIGNSTIKGALRIIIAANDADLIVNHRQALTNQSISAINERFLCVPIRDERARLFLDALNSHPDADAFFSGDIIPKHIWWLTQNRKVTHGPRFLVAGLPDSELEMRMMTGAGLRSEVCHWITSYLLAPESKRNMGSQAQRPIMDTSRLTGEKRMLVTPKMLHSLWGTFLEATAVRPHIGAIEKAMGGVCESKRVKKGIDNYRQVNLRRVKYWALVNGECTSQETFDEHLAVHGLKCGPVDIVEGVTEDDSVDEDE